MVSLGEERFRPITCILTPISLYNYAHYKTRDVIRSTLDERDISGQSQVYCIYLSFDLFSKFFLSFCPMWYQNFYLSAMST